MTTHLAKENLVRMVNKFNSISATLLPNKCKFRLFKNYRTISLISHPSREILVRVMLNRIKEKLEELMPDVIQTKTKHHPALRAIYFFSTQKRTHLERPFKKDVESHPVRATTRGLGAQCCSPIVYVSYLLATVINHDFAF